MSNCLRILRCSILFGDTVTQLLQRIGDEVIFPQVPRDVKLEIAPDHLNDFNAPDGFGAARRMGRDYSLAERRDSMRRFFVIRRRNMMSMHSGNWMSG